MRQSSSTYQSCGVAWWFAFFLLHSLFHELAIPGVNTVSAFFIAFLFRTQMRVEFPSTHPETRDFGFSRHYLVRAHATLRPANKRQ